MRTNTLVIALSGMPGSGKGSFISHLRELGAEIFQMGDEVRKELTARGLTPGPETLGMVAREMRKTKGPTIWAQRTFRSISTRLAGLEESGLIIIIDGLRSMVELDFFQKHFRDFLLVSIHTTPEIRWKRMRNRGRSDDFNTEEHFLQRDMRELEFGIGAVIAMSDEIIQNNGSPEELEEATRDFVKRKLG